MIYYIHYKNHKPYLKADDAVKIQVLDEWVDAVLYYSPEDPSLKFVRTAAEFTAKFFPVDIPYDSMPPFLTSKYGSRTK